MKIIIIGAGLGGLTAAFCFARRGHNVIVLEKRTSLIAQGGGILIRSCATRVLHSWGLAAKLTAISDQTPTSLLRNLETGQVAQRSILVDVSDFPEWGTSRQAMVELMHREAVAAGADIRLGCRVVDVGESQSQATVVLHEGNTRLEADIILAADGIHSRTRSKVIGNVQGPVDPVVSKSTLYGIQVSAAKLRADPEARTLTEESHHSLNVWMGQKGYVVGKYSINQKMWSAHFGIKSETSTHESLWNEHGDLDYVRTSFAGACTPLAAVLRLAQSCDRWKLAEMPDLARWTSLNGRIVLLGDSAHAMHPNAAQGFSQIIEDIGVLDFLVSHHHYTNPLQAIPQITEVWQHLRKPRVDRVKAYARWNTQLYEGEPLVPRDGDDQRKVKSLKHTKPDRDASFHSSAFMKWCLDHDPIAEAEQYLNALKARL